MEIKEIKDENILNEFKAAEWPSVDSVHFETSELVDFDEQERIFIAEVDKKVAGYFKIKTDMGVCTLNTIIVGKEYLRKGTGTALALKAEEEGRRLGCHKMMLETGVDWEAKKFYEQLGYQVVLVMKNHYDHRDFVLMEKFI